MSLFKSASTVSLLTLLSRITGFARETLIASAFGANAVTDAFRVAFLIPNLFRRLFAEGAFSQAFVPVLAATRAEQGDAATQVLIDKVATLLAWAVLITSVLGVLAAPGLVWLMASGLKQSPQGLETAVLLTRYMFPYIAFMSMVALSAGILNTWRRFAVPAATPVLLNVCMILAAWLGAPWLASRGLEPIYALAGGVMLGGVLQLAVQIPALKSLGLLPRIAVSPTGIRQAWQDGGTRRILAMMGPALLGVGVAQLSLLINTQIASHLTPGSVSWINFADRLMEFPIAMLGVALGVVLMPQLSAAKASGDSERYSAMLDWGLRLVLVLALPCAVALLVFAKPMVAVLYHYGAFTALDVTQTTAALTGHAGAHCCGRVGVHAGLELLLGAAFGARRAHFVHRFGGLGECTQPVGGLALARQIQTLAGLVAADGASAGGQRGVWRAAVVRGWSLGLDRPAGSSMDAGGFDVGGDQRGCCGVFRNIEGSWGGFACAVAALKA